MEKVKRDGARGVVVVPDWPGREYYQDETIYEVKSKENVKSILKLQAEAGIWICIEMMVTSSIETFKKVKQKRLRMKNVLRIRMM
jgi:hypothetical protein